MFAMLKKAAAFLVILCLTAALAACGSSSAQSPGPGAPSSHAQVTDDQLQDLLDKIYETCPDIMGVTEVDAGAAADILGLEPSAYDQLAARQSLARFNIGDVVIVHPTDGSTEAIMEGLEAYRQSREDLFQNYNVAGDYEKAQNAEIYQQGGYVVLVMLADNAPAIELIDGLLGS